MSVVSLSRVIVLLTVTAILTSPACGAVLGWINSAGGAWSDARNWNPQGPATFGDYAVFVLQGQTYTVDIGADGADQMMVGQGHVRLRRKSGSSGVLALRSGPSGNGDLTVRNNARLTIGASGAPLVVGVENKLSVFNGGYMVIQDRSDVAARQLEVGTFAGSQDPSSTLVVDGAGTKLRVGSPGSGQAVAASILGANGGHGILLLNGGAEAAFCGFLAVGSTASGGRGTLHVFPGSSLSTDLGLDVPDGELFVWDGASASAGGALTVGTGPAGTGSLRASGAGATVRANGGVWGGSGGTANVTLEKNAVATISGPLLLGLSDAAETTTTVDVLSGATLNAEMLSMAPVGGEMTSATLNIQGTGSAVVQTNTNGKLIVGHASTGAATINIRSSFDILNPPSLTAHGDVVIRRTGTINVGSRGRFTAHGDLLIDGGVFNASPKSFVDTRRNVTVQKDGIFTHGAGYAISGNTFNVLSGGLADFASNSLLIADGTLNVSGSGSGVMAGHGSEWGRLGHAATVTFSNRAVGNFKGDMELAAGSSPDSSAVVNVRSRSHFQIQPVEVGGVVRGHLKLATGGGANTSATLNIQDAGSAVELIGSKLTVGHASAGSATINIGDPPGTGGGAGVARLGAGGDVTINRTGRINVFPNGVFEALGPVHMNGGALNLSGGRFHLGNNFDGDLVNDGGTLRPMANPLSPPSRILGDYTQRGDATLEMVLASALASQSDFLWVDGAAQLGGELSLRLAPEFVPDSNQVFTLLNAGTLSGEFANVKNGQRLAVTDGAGSFIVHYGPNSAFQPNGVLLSGYALTAPSVLSGDFNGDGVVNAADYTVWRDGLGSTYSAGYYDEWQQNFGGARAGFRRPIPGNDDGAILRRAIAVPEPASQWLLLGIMAWWGRRFPKNLRRAGAIS